MATKDVRSSVKKIVRNIICCIVKTSKIGFCLFLSLGSQAKISNKIQRKRLIYWNLKNGSSATHGVGMVQLSPLRRVKKSGVDLKE